MKTNHDGTVTLNAYDTWTSCVACGQRVTGDSIHTCSPQLKEQDTECKYCKQGCFRCDARKQLTDEEIEEFEWLIKKQFNFSTGEKVVGLDRIIKAILRKAQER